MVGPGGSCGAYASFGGDPNALCTALRLRKQWLLTAYCTGHVRLYDVLCKSLVVQVLPSVVSSESSRGACPPYYSPTSYLRITCYYHDDHHHHSQVTAHARWINALDVHPTKDVFATAAEDCVVSVRRL